MGSSQTKEINEEKEILTSPSKAMTEAIILNSPKKEVKSSKLFGMNYNFEHKRKIIMFSLFCYKQFFYEEKQHIKMVDLLELSNQLGQSLDRLDYIAKQLEKRGVFLEKGLLGEGGSGYILKAFNDRDEKLAIKFVKCEDEDSIKQSLMEYKILRQFNCDYITKVRDLLQVEKDGETYHVIVMERCACDLKQFLHDIKDNHSVLSKKFVLEIFTQLVEGLDILHSKNIIHLDIKPANILYGYDKKWKYADLGVSKTVSNAKQHTSHLNGFTACYSSPEQFQIMSYNAKKSVTKASDIYSLGIVFLELTGVEINKKWLLKQKMQQSNNFAQYLNPEFEQLNQQVIMPMIAYQPESRIEPKQLIEILNEISSDSSSKRISQMFLQPQKAQASQPATLTVTDLYDIPAQEKSKEPEEDNSHLKKKRTNRKNHSVYEAIEGLHLQNEKSKSNKLVYSPMPSPSAEQQSQQQQRLLSSSKNRHNHVASSSLIKIPERLFSPENKKKLISEPQEDFYAQLDSPLMSHRQGRQQQSVSQLDQEEPRKIIKIQRSQEQRAFSQIKVLPPLLGFPSQELLSRHLSQEPSSRSINLKESSQYNIVVNNSNQKYSSNQNGNQIPQFNLQSRHSTNIFNYPPNIMNGQNSNSNMIGSSSSSDLHAPKDFNQYLVRQSHRQGTLPTNLDQFKNKLANIEKIQQIGAARLQENEENQVKFPLISPMKRRAFMQNDSRLNDQSTKDNINKNISPFDIFPQQI